MSKTLVKGKLCSDVLLNYFRALNVEKIYLIFWWRWYFLGTFSYNKLLLEVWMHICVSHNKIPPRSLNSIWWWPACITIISNLLSSRCCVAWLRRMFKMSSTHNWLPELVFSCLPCRALSSHAKWSESWVYIWIWSANLFWKLPSTLSLEFSRYLLSWNLSTHLHVWHHLPIPLCSLSTHDKYKTKVRPPRNSAALIQHSKKALF